MSGKNGSYHSRGIARPPKEKTGLLKFLDVYKSNFWKLMFANIIYFVFLIPLIIGCFLTIKQDSFKPLILGLITLIFLGPATSSLTKITRNLSQGRNVSVLSDFKESFNKFFKTSFIMGIIDSIFFIGFVIALPTYYNMAKEQSFMYVIFILSISFFIIFLTMNFYIYNMIISTNLSLSKVIKNSFLLVPLGLKSTFITLINILWIILFIFLFFPYSIAFLPFGPLSLIFFIDSYNCYPVIRKYVIQPYYDSINQKNPEFDYLDIKNDEKIFKDNPETDKPVTNKKSDIKKGKTIS